MTRIVRGALLCGLLGVAPASAQTDYSVALRVGGGAGSGAPQGSSLRVTGTGPRTAGQLVLGVDASGNVLSGGLGVADIPAPFTRRDVAETIAQPWTFSGGLLFADGTAGTPGARWASDTTTGLFRPGAGILGLSTGGTERARLSSAGLSLSVPIGSPSGTVELQAATDFVNPGTPMRTQLGWRNAAYLSLHVGELVASSFIADETIAYTYGSGMWSRGSTLTRDLGPASTTMYVTAPIYRYADYIVMRALSATGLPQYEIVRHAQLACVPQGAGDYACAIDRNLDGSGANTWLAGTAAISTDRMVNVYSYSPVKTSYWGSVLGDHPLLALNFAASPSVDLAGTGATATLGSGATFAAGAGGGTSSPGLFYRSGSAGAVFSGVQPGTALNGVRGTCAITVEMLVRIPDGGFSGTQAYVVTKGTPGTPGNHFAVLHRSTGSFALFGAPGGTWQQLTGETSVFTTAAYVHLVFAWSNIDGGYRYVNGVQEGGRLAPPAGGVCLPANPSAIEGAGQWVTGAGFGLSELAIYGYPLSQQQARAHYEARDVGQTSLTHGPTITGDERTSWSDPFAIETRWALGQLQGLYTYTTPTMGFAAGDAAATWVGADATHGFRVLHGSTERSRWATDGSILLGSTTGSVPNLLLTDTSVTLRRGTTLGLQLTALGLTLHDEGGTVLTRVSSGQVTVGQTSGTNANAFITGGRVELRRGTTVGLLLSSAGLEINDLGGVRRVRVDSTDGVTVGRQTTTGDAFVSVRAGDIRLCGFNVACTLTLDGASGTITSSGSLAINGTATIGSGVTVGTAGFLRSGQTAYATGTGYWLEFNAGTPRLSLGSPSKYLRWTGAELQVQTNGLTISDTGLTSNQVEINHSGVHIGNAFGAFSIAGRSISWDGSGGYFEFNGGLASAGGISAGGSITANGDIGSNVGSASFFMRGLVGQSRTAIVRDPAGTGFCTLIFTGGILTGGSC